MSMIKQYISLSEEKLNELKKSPKEISEFIWEEANDENKLDLDKAWHSIHYILTGSANESGTKYDLVVSTGESLGADFGYGPVQYLTPKEVKEVFNLLKKISLDDFEKKGNELSEGIVKNEIYPFWDGFEEEDLYYVMNYYADLRAFFKKASDSGLAVLHCLT